MKRADQLNQSILTVEEIEHRAQLMFDTHQDMGLCRRSELVTVSQRFQAALRRFNKTVYRILPDIDPEVVDPFIVPEYRRESKAGIDKVVGLMNKIHQERFGYRTTSWEQYTSEDLGWVRSGPAQIGALILSPDVENDINETLELDKNVGTDGELRLRPATPADLISVIMQNVIAGEKVVWPYQGSIKALDFSETTVVPNIAKKSALHVVCTDKKLFQFTARPSAAFRQLPETAIHKPKVLQLV